jgi:hypothetical protein
MNTMQNMKAAVERLSKLTKQPVSVSVTTYSSEDRVRFFANVGSDCHLADSLEEAEAKAVAKISTWRDEVANLRAKANEIEAEHTETQTP